MDPGPPVRQVLCEVLQVERVAPGDDFFDLGGDSLLVIEVVARLRAEHGLVLRATQFGVDARVAELIAAAEPVADS